MDLLQAPLLELFNSLARARLLLSLRCSREYLTCLRSTRGVYRSSPSSTPPRVVFSPKCCILRSIFSKLSEPLSSFSHPRKTVVSNKQSFQCIFNAVFVIRFRSPLPVACLHQATLPTCLRSAFYGISRPVATLAILMSTAHAVSVFAG